MQSIHMALLGGKSKRKEGPSKLPSTAKTCVIWVKSGHEVFQEARSKVLTILEEVHNIQNSIGLKKYFYIYIWHIIPRELFSLFYFGQIVFVIIALADDKRSL